MKLPKDCSKTREPRFEPREMQVLHHLQVRSGGGGRGSGTRGMPRGGIMEAKRGECFEKERSQPY